jgi:hypothetical protein
MRAVLAGSGAHAWLATEAAAVVNLHAPIRPSWRCALCSDPWPCDSAKQQLITEFPGARAALGMLMASYFFDAVQDLPRWAETGVYQRFLGWLRQ